MKRILSYLGLFATVLILGSTTVWAKSDFWTDYFKNGIEDYDPCSGVARGLTKWQDLDLSHIFTIGGCGDMPDPLYFYARSFTNFPVFDDVQNITITSSDESIITGEARSYDFSKEKKNFEDYVAWYNGLTLDEFKKEYNETHSKEYGNYVDYTSKPTWWEYNEYDKELTWWEAYGFDKEPTNAVEVISYAKDLGKAALTLKADNKQAITLNWTIGVIDFSEVNSPKKGTALVEILNNLDKYKDVIFEREDYDMDKSYNFSYDIGSKEDISEIINSLKGKDITIKFGVSSGFENSYLLNGLDIKNTVDKGFTYDHSMSMKTSINKEAIDSLVSLENAIYIDFTYHGILPTKYNLKVNVYDYIFREFYEKYDCSKYDYDTQEAEFEACYNKAHDDTEKFLKENLFTLLYYNPEKQEMEVVKDKLKVDENGNVVLEFDHFSSYVLATNYQLKEKVVAPTPIVNETVSNNVKTGTINVYSYLIVALGALIGVIYELKTKKKITK